MKDYNLLSAYARPNARCKKLPTCIDSFNPHSNPLRCLWLVYTPHSGELELEKTKVKQSAFGATEHEGRQQAAWLQSGFLFINEEAEVE